MDKCQIKVGFFVLRQCSNRAQSKCSRCLRPVCSKHRILEREICTECAGELDESDVKDVRPERFSNRGGFFSYRRHYYMLHDDLHMRDNEDLFDPEDAEAFDHPADASEFNDDVGFEDDADLFDS